MGVKNYLLGLGLLIFGFAGGFLLANSLNSAEIKRLESAAKNKSESKPAEQRADNLSDEEIRAKLKEAAERPDDYLLQKGLGIALYRFALMQQNAKYLREVEELLQRARKINPDDNEVLVTLANAQFDQARENKDNAKLLDARKSFQEAVNANPNDARVLNSLAETYIYSEEPDFENAKPILLKAYEKNSMEIAVLRNMARMHLAEGDTLKAGEFVAKLKKINPQDPEIRNIESQIRLEEAR